MTQYLSKNKRIFLFLSYICYGFAFITYSAVVFWIPVYLALVYFKKRKVFITIFISLAGILFLTLITRLLILSVIFKGSPFLMLHIFYLSNATQVGIIPVNLDGLLILLREFYSDIAQLY